MSNYLPDKSGPAKLIQFQYVAVKSSANTKLRLAQKHQRVGRWFLHLPLTWDRGTRYKISKKKPHRKAQTRPKIHCQHFTLQNTATAALFTADSWDGCCCQTAIAASWEKRFFCKSKIEDSLPVSVEEDPSTFTGLVRPLGYKSPRMSFRPAVAQDCSQGHKD